MLQPLVNSLDIGIWHYSVHYDLKQQKWSWSAKSLFETRNSKLKICPRSETFRNAALPRVRGDGPVWEMRAENMKFEQIDCVAKNGKIKGKKRCDSM